MIEYPPPADIELHDRIMMSAPREGLPTLSDDEIGDLEVLRTRYDALIGIISADQFGIAADIASSDVAMHPTWAGTIVYLEHYGC
jgi:hypothetical protein